VEAHGLDHRPDLWLGAPEPQPVAADPLAAREHRQVDHQRGVGEGELAQIDGHVTLGLDRLGQGPAAARLARAILLTTATQNRVDVIKLDDRGNLHKTPAERQVAPA
jgi:hypothetical protein